ncbi:MAG: type II toxin-antitoxin system Phd/YefM family antitoxin [Spirochaetes bacterium]|nr:type II toxin-antitoxin system Phd/YefM family antitoxin [Spirochaetota bacterium]MBN2771315.1 type II toxin-antitoxin system Phd/YefM family antitoxin [Spirochaetota bacterium]
MNISKDIRPISYIKSHAADILNQINESRRPVYITQNGEARAVLVDSNSYESMQKTIMLLKLVSQSEKDIIDGNYKDHDSFFTDLEKELDITFNSK